MSYKYTYIEIIYSLALCISIESIHCIDSKIEPYLEIYEILSNSFINCENLSK